MAEGGYEFENPEFDRDDYDKDETDEKSFMDEEDFQRTLNNQYKALDDLKGNTLEEHTTKLLKMMVDRFYERNQEVTTLDVDEAEWNIRNDGRGRPILYLEENGKDYEMSYYKSNKPDAILQFYSFDTLQRKYGVRFIRNVLGVENYEISAVRRAKTEGKLAGFAKASSQLMNVINKEEIPLQDLSTTGDVQNTIDTVNEVETSLQHSLADWNLELPDVTNAHTQTEGLTFRELQGLDKALQRTRGELANNLAKLTDLDKDIAKERRKLDEAEDEISKTDIKSRLKNLEDERGARLEAATANKEALRSQINRIKETINKVLKEDTTLGERLRTLFREQGITIVSVLTAIGMIIGVIVEAVIPSGGGTTPPKPSPKSGVKDWVKKQLQNLGKLLASLAGKAAAALPGIIGSIVSWLLSATGKVVNWFGNNLWALVVAVAGMLYVAAKEWIVK